MAEAIAKARMPRSWRARVAVSSAGTAAADGTGAAKNAVLVLKEAGIDLSGHRARQLAGEMVREADLVVAMADSHAGEILLLDPAAEGKVMVLGELDGSRVDPDVPDPIGGDVETYRRIRDDIAALVERLIDYLSDIFGLTK